MENTSRRLIAFDDNSPFISKQKKFAPLLKLLQEPGDQANLLAGSYGDVIKDNERHIFAAYYRCHYENLLGVEVDSIRPFGQQSKFGKDRILTDAEKLWQKQVSFKFAFDNAVSGDGSINQGLIKHLSLFTTEFHFDAPDSYFENVPWVEGPDNMDELLDKAREYDKQTPLTEWQLKSQFEREKMIKEWIEKDTQTIKHTKLSAFN